MAQGRLKVYGWGREGEGLTRDEEAFVMNGYHRMFGLSEFPATLCLRPPTVRCEHPASARRPR